VLLDLMRHHPASERDTQKRAASLLDEFNLTAPPSTPDGLDAVIKEILTLC
jgi:hypothetical protein